MTKQICFYFQVHQPRRLRRIQTFDSVKGYDVWDEAKNRKILERTARKCYLPANELIHDLIEQTGGAFRVAYSLSGVFLEQAKRHKPELIESFQRLADTGAVEFLAETYYHSLAGLWDDRNEFREQVAMHHEAIQDLFGQDPDVFRNTELIYDNRIAKEAARMGYDAILTEGTERVLGDRSANHVYRTVHGKGLDVLLKHYKLSDDIAFRFSTPDWEERPLTAGKYAAWLSKTPGETINLFMDYETFGEHQWPETGIFEFLEHLPHEVAKRPDLSFGLPSEVSHRFEARDTLDVPHAISWADEERDVSAWLHNKMQHECFQAVQGMQPLVRDLDDPGLTHAWRLLQTSDHLYYCTTKHLDDQAIHSYFSPYDSPYMAYINYMNAIQEIRDKANALLIH